MSISNEELKARIKEYYKGNLGTAWLTQEQLLEIAKEAAQTAAETPNVSFISVFDNLVFMRSITEGKAPE